MKVKDILSKEEVQDYHAQWKAFSSKNIPETTFNVHSSLPVISPVMVYRKEPIPVLRARVFQEELRTYDPYFVAKKYGNPFWHIQHYIMVVEQMYHAATNMIRDNSRLVVKDTLQGANMRIPTFWSSPHKHVSVELLLEPMPERKGAFLFSEFSHFTIYDDKKNFPIATLDFNTYAQERAYLREFRVSQDTTLEPGERLEALRSLTRKLDMQHVRQTQWATRPRTTLTVGRTQLVELIQAGQATEHHLYDFFSLWDGVPNQQPANQIAVDFTEKIPPAA